MNTNAKRGAYFKSRTKKWLITGGYQVADLEVVRWIYRPGQQPMPVKRDQFGADLLAMDATRLVFVQVKGGEAARGGTFPAARREFAKFVFPVFAERWIVAWPPRAREPRLVVIVPPIAAEGETDGKEGVEGAAQGRGQINEAEAVALEQAEFLAQLYPDEREEIHKGARHAREASRSSRRAVAGHGRGATP